MTTHLHVHRSGYEIVLDLLKSILQDGKIPTSSDATYIEIQNVIDLLEEGLPLSMTNCPDQLWNPHQEEE